jgi:acyl carrier protein
MDDLETEIRKLIVEALKLEDLTWQDVDCAAPLFGDGPVGEGLVGEGLGGEGPGGEGLGLDSIDALELGVAIRQRYGIKIEAVNDEVRAHFYSVRSLAAFITEQRGGDRVAR